MSIDASSATRRRVGPASERFAGRGRETPAAALALVAALVCLLLVIAAVVSGWNVLHSTGFFTALAAKKYVWANALAALLVAVAAALTRGRWRWLAVAGPAAYLLAILAATAIPGGQLLAMLTALLTMTAMWDTGERLLRRLGADALARIVLVAWLAGIGPWSLGIVALGRVSLVKWWTVGLLLMLLGSVGLVRLARRLLTRRTALMTEISASAMNIASAGLILLTLGWAAIYTAAPEIQYDALYGKEFLPELWARTGHVSAVVQHVQDAITGWFQILAVNGHLFGATAVGRYMQLFGLIATVSGVWWWGRRYGMFGPLAALAVAVTPHLLWQASTADDDLLLALAAFALCVAIVESLRAYTDREVRGVAFALGLMAGSGPSLKLHLLPLCAVLLLGWVGAGRASKSITRRFTYAALGAAVTALPPLVLRWIDTGNPVLPAYNNIFRSPYWLPINETLNFPFWPHPGAFGPIVAVWKAVTEPGLMVEDAPPGAFGVLIGAIVVAALFGWLGHDRDRAARVVWIALLPALAFWWISFRYLRYLLPIGLVSVALVLMITPATKIGSRGRGVVVAVMTVAVIASFPVAISQFWNVPAHKPPVVAAVGHWSEASYLSDEFSERPAVLAFNQLSSPGSRMASDAFQRVWLTGERDLYNLHYEVLPLMELHGPPPVTGDEALVALRKLGIEWLMVTEADRLQHEAGYISQVISSHGKDEFSSRGWDLYRLVQTPPRLIPLASCDSKPTGVSSCWGVVPTSHLTVSVTRPVPVCAGETIAVKVDQAPGGQPSPVQIVFQGASAQGGVQTGATVPGLSQTIYATTPPGAHSANVTISPAAASSVASASISRLEGGCRATS